MAKRGGFFRLAEAICTGLWPAMQSEGHARSSADAVAVGRQATIFPWGTAFCDAGNIFQITGKSNLCQEYDAMTSRCAGRALRHSCEPRLFLTCELSYPSVADYLSDQKTLGRPENGPAGAEVRGWRRRPGRPRKIPVAARPHPDDSSALRRLGGAYSRVTRSGPVTAFG